MVQETYDWSTHYFDEQSGGTTTFTSLSGDTVDITVSQPDPNGYYQNNGDGFENDIQGGLTGGQFEMRVNYSDNSQTVSTTINFASNTATASDTVSNLTFTLTDLDSPSSGGYQDQVTILAYDSNGNLLPVTLTAADSNVVSVNGSTATAILGAGSGGSQSGNVASNSSEGNLNVAVTGDVAQIVIVYGNGPDANSNPTNQVIGISDLSFDMLPAIICFTRGTMIQTETGDIPVEALKIGDLVMTADSGPQPITWIGSRVIQGKGKLAPVQFAKNAIGNQRPLLVSPNHRMVVTGWENELTFGCEEVLIAANYLINHSTITQVQQAEVEYFHIMFERHEVIFAEGAACESLFLSAATLKGMGPDGQAEIRLMFPELFKTPRLFGDTARRCLRDFEARLVA